MTDSFISGLVAVLTPSVFPLLLIIPIIFERLGKHHQTYLFNILAFILLSTIILNLLLSKWFTIDRLNDIKQNDIFFVILYLLKFIFLTCFLLSFTSWLKCVKKRYFEFSLSLLGIVVFSISLSLTSLSSIGPLLGTLIVGKSLNTLNNNFSFLLFSFSVGLLLPFLVILLIFKKHYKNLRLKKWWRLLQIIVVSYLILSLMIKSITFFIV